MRLGIKTRDEFIELLNNNYLQLQKEFLTKIQCLSSTYKIKTMMGDSTIKEPSTFDPKRIADFFEYVVRRLDGWSIQEVTSSNNDDIRRIFAKFEIIHGNYLMSGHLSIQFHVLLYYKPDQRVIDCQRDLDKIIDQTKNKEEHVADHSDDLVLNKLKDRGYKNLDHQNLFEILYDNDELRSSIYAEIEESQDTDFKQLEERKKKLFAELDSLLIEVYQMAPVLIDDTRLVTGEEGCLCTIDLEFLKGNTKEGLFDTLAIPTDTKDTILKRLDELHNIIKSYHVDNLVK